MSITKALKDNKELFLAGGAIGILLLASQKAKPKGPNIGFHISQQDLNSSVFTRTGRTRGALPDKSVRNFNRPEQVLAALALADATFASGEPDPEIEAFAGPGGRGGQGGCFQPGLTTLMGLALDSGDPQGAGPGQAAPGFPKTVAVKRQIYDQGKSIMFNGDTNTTSILQNGMVQQMLNGCGLGMGSGRGGGGPGGPGGGRGPGGPGGPGGGMFGPGGFSGYSFARSFAVATAFAGPRQAGGNQGGRGGRNGPGMGNGGQDDLGTGLCGGDFRRIRAQAARAGQNNFQQVTGLIDSGTPVCLLSNQIAQKLGVGGGGGGQGGRGGGMFQLAIKVDPSDQPINGVPGVIDDRGQGMVFMPIPIVYITMRVNVTLNPDSTVLEDRMNKMNVVTYDCKTNAIMGGMNPQNANAVGVMNAMMMGPMMGRRGGMMGMGPGNRMGAGPGMMGGFANQVMKKVQMNGMNQMMMNKMMMNDMVDASGLKSILTMGQMQEMAKEQRMMLQMMRQKELMELMKPIPGQDTGSA